MADGSEGIENAPRALTGEEHSLLAALLGAGRQELPTLKLEQKQAVESHTQPGPVDGGWTVLFRGISTLSMDPTDPTTDPTDPTTVLGVFRKRIGESGRSAPPMAACAA